MCARPMTKTKSIKYPNIRIKAQFVDGQMVDTCPFSFAADLGGQPVEEPDDRGRHLYSFIPVAVKMMKMIHWYFHFLHDRTMKAEMIRDKASDDDVTPTRMSRENKSLSVLTMALLCSLLFTTILFWVEIIVPLFTVFFPILFGADCCSVEALSNAARTVAAVGRGLSQHGTLCSVILVEVAIFEQ